MRYAIPISVNTKIQGPLTIPWEPEQVYCINPNNANLYLRVGGNDAPKAATADIRFPKNMFSSFPIFGLNFGFQLGDPGDTINDVTTLVFTKDEPVPSFGALPLTSVNATIAGTVTVSGNVAIPSGVVTNAGSVTQTGAGSVSTTQSGSQTSVPGGVVTNAGSSTVTSIGSITTTQSGSQTTVPAGVVTNSGSQNSIPGGVVTNAGSVSTTQAGSVTITNAGSQTTVPGGVVTNAGSQNTIPGGVVTNSGSQTYVGQDNASWNAAIASFNIALFGSLNIGAFPNNNAGGWQLILAGLTGPDVRLQWFESNGVGTAAVRYFRIPTFASVVIITLPIMDSHVFFQLVNDIGPGNCQGNYYLRRTKEQVNEIGITTYQDLPLQPYDINIVTVVGNVRGPQLVSGATFDDKWIVGFQLAATFVFGGLPAAFLIDLFLGSNVAPITFIGRGYLEPFQYVAPNTTLVMNTGYMQPNSGQPGGLLTTIGLDYLWITAGIAGIVVRGAAFVRRRL